MLTFLKDYLLRLAVLDGARGWAAAYMAADYAVYKRMRHYEMRISAARSNWLPPNCTPTSCSARVARVPPELVPYVAVALPVVHFVLAAGVTLHVLAHNRNPGSAVSWIGLAWLSPVVGSLLYALLGINRVQRRARSQGVVLPHDPPIEASPAPAACAHLAGLELAGRRISRRTSSPTMPSACWPTATPPTRR